MEPTGGSVEEFLDAVPGKVRRRDARTMADIMQRITGEEPRMWGTIIGFGEYHYRYDSGREGRAGAAGFAPRKGALTVYLPEGVARHRDALSRLGPHTSSLVCLYLKDLSKVDLGVLEGIIADSYRTVSAGGFGRPDRGA